MLLVAHSCFPKVSEDWQPSSREESQCLVDCSVLQYLSRGWVVDFGLFESREITSVWSLQQ